MVSNLNRIQNSQERRDHLTTDPDLELIEAIAAKDMTALDELYTRRSSAILGYLVTKLGDRELAEEVLQDVMLSAWKNAANFRGDSKVLTWLLSIARNRAINTFRKKKPSLVALEDAFELRGSDTGPLEQVERNDRRQEVAKALHQLAEPQREVLLLVFYHQLTGPEIAEVLNISVGTVKSRLHRAKQALRQVLEVQGEV